MKQSISNGSITITLPDAASNFKELTGGTKPRSRRGPAAVEQETSEFNKILVALTDDESGEQAVSGDRVVGFSADVGGGAPKRRSRTVHTAKQESMDVNVALAPDESAVVLIEQDGAYEWYFPKKIDRKIIRRTRGVANVDSKSAHFSIPIGQNSLPQKQRSKKRSLGEATINYIQGKVTGFIVKFIARKAVGAISRRLEKGVEAGPVIINSATDIADWKLVRDFTSIKLPKDRPARIFLLIHGTFSSTRGSFGALTEHEAGQGFLNLLLQQYDAVLAYDHYTLADTPAQNAEEIFTHLHKLQQTAKHALSIDALSYSRGGLVYRYLTEQIVPEERSPLIFNKAIFVGCTNAGTELANHQNWKTLIDFYTTMVAGASRLLSLHPGSRVAGEILIQGFRIIGSLVKYIVENAVAENAVPGLASMRPKSSFITEINKSPLDRKRSGARSYFAIGSDFEPGPNTSIGKLGERVALKGADRVVDRLMNEKNDLVVNQASMFVIDPLADAKLSGKMAFDKSGEIYHTVYFHQPQIARQCAEWLELLPLKDAAQNVPRDWWPSEISRDFTQLSATASVEAAARILRNNQSRFVVLEQHHSGDLRHYGISRGAFENYLEDIQDRDAHLADVLDMHKSDARSMGMADAIGLGDLGILRSETKVKKSLRLPGELSHKVILGDTGPIGVAAPPEIVTAKARGSIPRTSATGKIKKVTNKEAPTAKRGRSRSRTTPRASPIQSVAPAIKKLPKDVWCYAHATMDEEAVVNRKSSVEVTLSRDKILRAMGETSAGGGGKVRVDEALIVEIQARKHCIVKGESRVEVPVPAPGKDTQLFFDITPKHEGVGEVRIIVRQGNRPIANLTLFPRFVTRSTGKMVGLAKAEAQLTPTDSRREITNVLFIREAQMGDARALDFELEFEVGGQKARIRGRSQPFADENVRLNYIKQLYIDLEEFWAESSSDYENFLIELRARGALIFNELIPQPIRKAFWEHRNELNAIQVFSDEPLIPWELAYLVEPGRPISKNSHFLAEKGMVRGYSIQDGQTLMAPTILKYRKDMVKYIIPTYPEVSEMQLPEAQREKQMLIKLFGAKPVKANKKDVLDMMEPGKFDILHFACHGIADPDSIWDANLLMQGKMLGDIYKEDRLTSTEVLGYTSLRDESSPGPLVFLNACQIGRSGYGLTTTGGFASAFLKSGAGAFVGTHWSVGDGSARVFSETFYTQLKEGKNMIEAVTKAREAAKNNGEFSWLAYVVYADPYAKLVSG